MSVLEVQVTSSRIGGDAHVVAVSGELDLYAAEKVQTKLADLLEGDARTVVVDLLGVSFMDSTGLAVLLGAAKALRSAGGRLVTVVDSPRVLRVVDFAGAREFLHVQPTVIEAIQHVVDQRLTA